jgi:hypothetical protein
MGSRGPKPGADNAGRPRKEVDMQQLENLCKIQCTQVECATFFGMDRDILADRIKEVTGLSFPEFYEMHKGSGKISLRRTQMKMALGGDGQKPNVTMLIWLGKQYLGQSDRNEVTHEGSLEIVRLVKASEMKDSG